MEIDSVDAPSTGSKRKADDVPLDASPPRRIKVRPASSTVMFSDLTSLKALNPDVVNKIAAGEIIVAPVHALKELIENSVDAGSTALDVVVKDGGLKLLQITDNGHGIDVCSCRKPVMTRRLICIRKKICLSCAKGSQPRS
jgi:DNA mismatch repair protein MLH1